jgi:hypothetical protein
MPCPYDLATLFYSHATLLSLFHMTLPLLAVYYIYCTRIPYEFLT